MADQNQPADPAATLKRRPDGTAVVQLRGNWKQPANLPAVETLLGRLDEGGVPVRVEFDGRELSGWDSGLMALVMGIFDACAQRKVAVDTGGLPEGAQRLVRLARAVPPRSTDHAGKAPRSFLAAFGEQTIEFARSTGEVLTFLGDCVQATVDFFRGKAMFRRVDLFLFAQAAGAEAFPIVSLISILIGMILAFVGAYQLKQFGAEIYIAAGVAIGVVREMAPMMTGIIMAGRTGAAFAAQIGTMQVNEEVDALRTAGFSPIGFLVLPRLIALAVMMPMLCLYAMLMGIGGGAIVSVTMFGIPLNTYIDQTRSVVSLSDFSMGVGKGLVFGIVVAAVGCLRGMQCGRSASAVGEAATSAVVSGIVAIILLDSLAAVICTVLHI